MARKHLPNAPIIEAVLDLKVLVPDKVNIEVLQSIHGRIKNDYPHESRRMQLSAHVKSSAPFDTVADAGLHSKQVGFFFWSADKRQAVQARLDGFSFSRLRPYENWESFRTEAIRLWTVYAQVVDPTSIERIALRYINRMEFPQPLKLEDYLATFPQVGPGCPQTLSGLFMRLVAQDGECNVIITEAIDETGITPETAPVILDIDAFRQISVSPSNSDRIWSILDELRTVKNNVFFNSITPKAEALFT